MGTTGGLVSAYQVLDCSAQRILARNLATTGAEEVFVKEVSLPYMLNLREYELVHIKVPFEQDKLAFAVLMNRTQIEVLPGNILGITRESLKFLDQAGISYKVVE